MGEFQSKTDAAGSSVCPKLKLGRNPPFFFAAPTALPHIGVNLTPTPYVPGARISPPWQPEPLLHQGDQRSEGGRRLEQLYAAVPVRGTRNPESSSCGAWRERCDFLHTCYLYSHPFSSQEPGT